MYQQKIIFKWCNENQQMGKSLSFSHFNRVLFQNGVMCWDFEKDNVFAVDLKNSRKT